MLVITTPTGHIGRQTLTDLLAANQPVRAVVRDPSRLDPDVRDRVEIVEGSHADPSVLSRALDGADGLLWLVPPSLGGVSAREYYLEFTRSAAEAIRVHGVSHVVGISSAGHGWSGVQMAHVISDVLGRPVAYTRLSLPDVAAAMIQRGASDGVAHDMVEMISAQNAGIYEADQASAHPPPTRFRAWCEEVLRPAIRL